MKGLIVVAPGGRYLAAKNRNFERSARAHLKQVMTHAYGDELRYGLGWRVQFIFKINF